MKSNLFYTGLIISNCILYDECHFPGLLFAHFFNLKWEYEGYVLLCIYISNNKSIVR